VIAINDSFARPELIPVNKLLDFIMRYVPNLHPETSKVLPDYFKSGIYKPAKKNILVSIIKWFLGAFFIQAALALTDHHLMFLFCHISLHSYSSGTPAAGREPYNTQKNTKYKV
jgi:hypothetical protein